MEFWGQTAVRDFAAQANDVSTLLVVGAGSSQQADLADAIAQFEGCFSQLNILTLETSLPHLEVLPDAIECEQIIGLGGGKTLDIAKLQSLGLSKAELRATIERGQLRVPRMVPLTCIPTTCGSGSEATHFAVCYLGGEKHSIAHPSLVPDHVVLAPQLVRGQSEHQLRIGALDALCQGIEAMFSQTAT